MPVMAVEEDIITSPNVSLNASLEDVQTCRTDSSDEELVDENKNAMTEVTRHDRSCGDTPERQNGEFSQNMELFRDSVPMEVDQVAPKDSIDIPVSLGTDGGCTNAFSPIQTTCSSSENLECTENSGTPYEKKITCTPKALTEGISKQKTGLPLPVTPVAKSGVTSCYFTRSAKKACVTDLGPHALSTVQSSTCTSVRSESPTASGLATLSKPLTTVNAQDNKTTTTVSSTPSSAQDVLAKNVTSSPYFTRSATKKAHITSSVPKQVFNVKSAISSHVASESPTTSDVTNSTKPLTTQPLPLPLSSESIPVTSSPTTEQAVVKTSAITSTSVGSSVSVSTPALPLYPASLSNIHLVVKQDNPVSTGLTPVHIVTSQSLTQALATCNLPMTVLSTGTTASNFTPLMAPIVEHSEKAQPTTAIVSSAVTTASSLTPLPSISNSTVLATIPAAIKSPVSEVPVKANSNDEKATSVHIVTPQILTQALATCNLPMTVSSTATTAANCTPVTVMTSSAVNNSDKAQPTIAASTVLSATSSSLSLSTTNNPLALATIPLAITNSEPEKPIKGSSTEEKATADILQASTNPSTESTASTASSTSILPDIPALFPEFKPCSKCNSILVCSCPGPSGIGDAPTTCQAAGQGDGTSDGMHVNQNDGVSPPEEDVKPQVLPAVPLGKLDQLFDDLVEYDKVAKAEQPEAIITRLFPYQLQALNWMITRENNTDLAPFWTQVNKKTWLNKGTNISTDRKPNSPKGGILADDMGLGKTLTVITLIMANHLNGKPMFSRKSSANKRALSSSQDGECKSEPPEKIPRKDSNNNDQDRDVVMENKESAKTVTIKKRKDAVDRKKRLADSKTIKQPGFKFRQMYLPKFSSKSIKKEKIKEEKEVPKPKSSPAPISIDLDDGGAPWLCAGNTKGSNNRKSAPEEEHGATLIVCPLSVLSNWTDQICSHVHPDVSLQVYMYYGAERLRDVNFLKQQDIVLTTYPTLTNDYGRNDSPLHKIKWLRIILDEGHTIRNPQTRLTKAMLDLAAKRRWVLTGTPIQNRLDDLWSVCKFLRLEPFDDKGWWKSALASSVRRGDQQGVNRLQKLLKHISIRRMKTDEDDGKPLVKLPPRTVVIQEVELSEEERKLYDSMQKHGQFIIRGYLREGTVLAKYAHCFAILMRLRQLCLHPKLCDKECASLQRAQNLLQGLDDSDDDDELDVDHDTQRLIKDLIMTLSSGSDEECSVCLDSLVEPVITRCAHVFCQQCIMDVMTSDNLAPRCPLCRAPLNENELIKVPEKKKQKPEAKKTSEEKPVESKKSAKLDALMNALCAIRDKDPSIKSLVVSQFTSFLDIIEEALEKQDFTFVRLDGRMTQEARARAIENFADTSSSSPRVFLLSLTAGGVGLNLTAATRVFLMDPAWNPAIEEQCFDRSHRLGQTKEVIITKYIVMNSVEERMLTLQEHKRTLMGQAFGMETQSQEERRRARVRDIKHLIGL